MIEEKKKIEVMKPKGPFDETKRGWVNLTHKVKKAPKQLQQESVARNKKRAKNKLQRKARHKQRHAL